MSQTKVQYLAYDIGIKLRKLMKKIDQVQTVLIDDEMTRSEERIIFPIIKDERGYTIQELSEMGGVAKSLASRTISSLEHKGFVRRDKATEEQDRNYKIVLTEKGNNFVQEKNERVIEVLYTWFSKIPVEFIKTFDGMLDTLLEIKGGEQ